MEIECPRWPSCQLVLSDSVVGNREEEICGIDSSSFTLLRGQTQVIRILKGQ